MDYSSEELMKINECLKDLAQIQLFFRENYGVDDIFSNSKFYEMIIANQLGHSPIPGHSGSRDAKDKNGNEIEYKHFKESSSNHSWTFNDFSDNLISHMHEYSFVFSHIDDVNYKYPGIMDWYYLVDGSIMERYLSVATQKIQNSRKMINVSPRQLESLGIRKQHANTNTAKTYEGAFKTQLLGISNISERLEKLTGVDKILTSNKLYELLVALKLNHKVNPENGGRLGAHDAEDKLGNTYEYKVYKTRMWNFQDISDAVLDKYLLDKKIILAVVDKENLKVEEIYSADPSEVVPVLRSKLQAKARSLAAKGKELRRKQISLSYSDITSLNSFMREY